jgi:hypothetical protein
MLALRWKTLPGSYSALIRARRSYFRPYDVRVCASSGSALPLTYPPLLSGPNAAQHARTHERTPTSSSALAAECRLLVADLRVAGAEHVAEHLAVRGGLGPQVLVEHRYRVVGELVEEDRLLVDVTAPRVRLVGQLLQLHVGDRADELEEGRYCGSDAVEGGRVSVV